MNLESTKTTMLKDSILFYETSQSKLYKGKRMMFILGSLESA